MEMLPAFINGEIKPESQDDSLATYASKLSKQEAEIDWEQSAETIERCVRAYNAWPVAFTQWLRKGTAESLRVWSAVVRAEACNQAPGTVINTGKDGIDVATGDGLLRLLELQPAGKRNMSAADFVNAYSLDGQVLGAR